MIFDKTIYVNDIISIISSILAFVGGAFAYVQWRETIKTKRAQYINDLTEKIRADEDIREMVYVLEYDTPWYNDDFHDSGELERKMDKTFSHFSYICYLYKTKLLSDAEFEFFKYEIERIISNPQTKNYFFNLYHFANRLSTPITFKYLFEYGLENNLFDKEFFNSKSEEYVHCLNF